MLCQDMKFLPTDRHSDLIQISILDGDQFKNSIADRRCDIDEEHVDL
jgi:hypothetical protein